MYQKGIDDAVFELMFQAVNIGPDDFIQVPHSFKNSSLIDKEVDAMSVYQTNQPFYFRKKGIKTHIINPMNYGVDLYGDMLFTNTLEAKNHPERVKAVRRAVIKGWYYAINNIDEINNLIKDEYNPKADLELLNYEAKETMKFINSHLTPIGTVNTARLERIANIYRKNDSKKNRNLKYLIFDEFIKSEQRVLSPYFVQVAGAVVFVFTLIISVTFYFNRKLKKQVELKTKHIKEQQKQKDLFFSKMTHELRTPLNAIMGATFFLKEIIKDTEEQSYVKIIDNSSKHLLGLVDDILDFNKLEVNKITLINEPSSLNVLVRESTAIHQLNAESKGLDFELTFIKEEDIMIEADPLRFKQIMNNLLSNAIKFTSEGKISVICNYELVAENVKIFFKVIDTGRGIPKDKVESIFNPFQQENDSISKEYGGTGLGLGISKELVALYDGSIKVEENIPSGTVFEFSLECEKAKVESIEEARNIDFEIPKNLRVLIVDDNSLNLLMLRKYLLKLGIKCTEALNGKEALSILEESEYDIVIMDKLMPIMDGPTTAKKIREHKDEKISQIYIIGNSANWLNGLDEECLELGMNASLAKPVRFDQLQKTLSDYVQKRPQSKKAA